ncbi:MAG: hypothetical protein J7M29_03575, partial [Verrucomicrobia bacterium]|nr:hypothetical protein [Verrucomicrobiota bacterium]
MIQRRERFFRKPNSVGALALRRRCRGLYTRRKPVIFRSGKLRRRSGRARRRGRWPWPGAAWRAGFLLLAAAATAAEPVPAGAIRPGNPKGQWT